MAKAKTTSIADQEQALLAEKLPLYPFYVQKYMQHRKSRLRPKTMLDYLADFQQFYSWLSEYGYYSGEMKDIPLPFLESLKLDTIHEYVDYLGNTYQKTTANRYISSLKSLFRYLSQNAEDDEGYVLMKRNVMSKVSLFEINETTKYRSENLQNAILHVDEQENVNEIRDFINFIENEYPHKCTKRQLSAYEKNKERDLAIISLFLDSGLRVFELVALNINDVEFAKNILKVHEGKGNKKDVVYFGDLAYVYLKDYLNIRESRYKLHHNFPPLFVSCGTGIKGEPDRITKRAVQNLVKKYATLFEKHSLSCHKLRHSFGTELFRQTKDIMIVKEQLRHKHHSTTEIYTHVANDRLKHAVKQVNDFSDAEPVDATVE